MRAPSDEAKRRVSFGAYVPLAKRGERRPSAAAGREARREPADTPVVSCATRTGYPSPPAWGDELFKLTRARHDVRGRGDAKARS